MYEVSGERGTKPKPDPAATRLGFDVKPVSVTYTLAAILLFVISTRIQAS